MVLAGRVLVNGQIPKSAGIEIDSENDVIEVDGKRVFLETDKVYILLNKLPGYISAVTDSRGERTIMELLPNKGKRLYPIGRLDKDTEGLIIVTNDGELTYSLTHPSHYVNKVYLVWVQGTPDEEALEKLCQGIMLEDGMTAPALVERVKHSDGDCLKITIHEGRKRQIKRMCLAVGHKVLRLKRIQVGTICLGDLKPGEFRYLTEDEVQSLKEIDREKK